MKNRFENAHMTKSNIWKPAHIRGKRRCDRILTIHEDNEGYSVQAQNWLAELNFSAGLLHGYGVTLS
jgi:hypothetical protein